MSTKFDIKDYSHQSTSDQIDTVHYAIACGDLTQAEGNAILASLAPKPRAPKPEDKPRYWDER